MALKDEIRDHFPAPDVTPEAGRSELQEAARVLARVRRTAHIAEALAGLLPNATGLNAAFNAIRNGLQEASQVNRDAMMDLGGRVMLEEFADSLLEQTEAEGTTEPS